MLARILQNLSHPFHGFGCVGGIGRLSKEKRQTIVDRQVATCREVVSVLYQLLFQLQHLRADESRVGVDEQLVDRFQAERFAISREQVGTKSEQQVEHRSSWRERERIARGDVDHQARRQIVDHGRQQFLVCQHYSCALTILGTMVFGKPLLDIASLNVLGLSTKKCNIFWLGNIAVNSLVEVV